MYCPNCGTDNGETFKFCRKCGTNLLVISKTLSGEISPYIPRRLHNRSRDESPSIEKCISHLFMGIAFLLVSLASFEFAPEGKIWFFWFLIPAFALMGKGIGELVKLRFGGSLAAKGPQSQELPLQQKEELLPQGYPDHIPASVTEGTTRTLDQTQEKSKENA